MGIFRQRRQRHESVRRVKAVGEEHQARATAEMTESAECARTAASYRKSSALDLSDAAERTRTVVEQVLQRMSGG